MSSVRLHRALLLAALVVPALLFAAAAWQNHRDVLREGSDGIVRTCAVMQEHARKVFETAELTIGWVDDRIDDEDWPTIASPATSEFLHRLRSSMDQIVSLWVADGDGIVRAGSQPWPAGSGIGPREFFQRQRTATGLGISAPFRGVATGLPSFAVIRRRTVPNGAFDGTVHAAIDPAYFTRFYQQAAPPGGHVAALILTDGIVLAREPANGDQTLDAGSAVQQAIASGALGGAYEGVGAGGKPLIYAVRPVGTYPVYVVFAVPKSALLERWRRNLRIYGLVAGAAAATLLAVSYLALRRAQAEQSALILLEEAGRQRLEAEQQLRHSQRMDAVGQLTGGIAHDFNNLLTAILGNLELIQRAAVMPSADVGPRVMRLSTTAMKAVQRGAALTKSLLAFSRKQPLNPRPVDANRLLLDFMDLVRQAAGPGVEVAFEPTACLPACVADPAELEAAVLNLTINARDAMTVEATGCDPCAQGTGAKRLRVRTSAVHLDEAALVGNADARPGLFVAIEIADTGMGMTGEVARKAFEPFFTTKPIGRGTGLGLSQVHGFVHQLRGHVSLISEVGTGTIITLYLPASTGSWVPVFPPIEVS